MDHRERSLIQDVIFDRWSWRLLILLSSLMAAVTGLAAPWFQKEFIDHLTGSVPAMSLGWYATSLPWILLAFAAMLLSQGFSQLTSYLGAREAIFLQRRFSRRLYEKMLSLRADTMSRHSLGEAVSLYATDVPGATVFIDQTLPMGASTLFPLILAPFALSAFFQTPLLPTVLLIVAIALLNTTLAFRQSRFFYRFKQLAAERTGLVNEWIQNIRTLRILGWTAAFEKAIFRKRVVETDNRVSMVTNGQIMNSISTSVTFFLNIATLAVLTLWSERTLSAGEILAVLWILGVFLTRPFRQMPWFFTFGFDAWTSLRRLQLFLDTENRMTRPSERPSPAAPGEAALDVANLRLVVNDQVLLDDVSFAVKPGEFVAIVGEVGSGKTLLLLSLLRETGAAFGRYRIEGRDALGLSEEELRGFFSFVPQEGFIMSANLRDNVVFDYDTDPGQDAAVLKSLKAAQFNLDRERVERGLETEIGERGVNLSGGQRQRVSLARVHYARGPILLLDDCLSAVDVDTEEKLLAQLLNGEWKHRTRLLVTHRLTVLDQVDRILFFKDGRLIEQGSFHELNERSKEFRDFTVSVRRLAGEAPAPLLPPEVSAAASEPLPALDADKTEGGE
ncbi:MAG: ABC transporter ATP-binding protein [Bdellovibrionaceae bacterium]|nr:ABC transporter ATP-binding protein [Pseudobdellovibrionaceae bacterium]